MIRCRLLPALLSVLPALAQTANTKAPNASEQTAALAAIREYALNYTQRLPDYVCLQSTRVQSTTFSVGGDQRDVDAVEAQVGVVDHHEVGKITARNGRPPGIVDPQDLGQTLLRGEAGALLAHLFDPQSSTEFRWDKVATRDGKRMFVFSYRVPQSKGYVIPVGKATFVVPIKGLVYADPATKAVLRIEMQGTDIPGESMLRSLDLKVNYKSVSLGDKEFVLPSDFEMNAQNVIGTLKVTADYKDFRRFNGDKAEFAR